MRQAIFAGETPLYFPDSIGSAHQEPVHWRRFWEDHGIGQDAVDYATMVESGTVVWPNVGLPPGRHVLLPDALSAFIPKGKHVVAHGGIALEEVIVPFIRISRDER